MKNWHRLEDSDNTLLTFYSYSRLTARSIEIRVQCNIPLNV